MTDPIQTQGKPPTLADVVVKIGERSSELTGMMQEAVLNEFNPAKLQRILDQLERRNGAEKPAAKS